MIDTTSDKTGTTPAAERAPRRALPALLALRLSLTRAAIAVERALDAFWPLLALLLVGGAAALTGAIAALPGWLHLLVLLAFAAGLAWLLRRGIRRFAWPGEALAGQRMERASGVAHRPLTAAFDTLPADMKDPLAASLFALHRQRARARLARLRAAGPAPVLAAADPRGLTVAAVLALVVGLVMAGPDWLPRLKAAVEPRFASGAAALPPTLDAWLDPPDYTDFAPLYLSDLPADAPPVAVPAGSRIIAQVQGGDVAPKLALGQDSDDFAEAAPGLWKIEQEIEAGQDLTISQDGDTLGQWQLTVLPDAPPEVRFSQPPTATERQALALAYAAEDDYGLVNIKLVIRRADDPALPPLTLDLANFDGGRKEAQGQTYKDLTEHLWAGFAVEMTLVATDALGQEGSSETVRGVLPERVFTNPVARALVELRRRLTVDPDTRQPVVRALLALIDQHEAYNDDSVVALALSAAAGRLLHDPKPEAVGGVQKLLWDTALRLEDGDVSLMAESLRDIQERLKQALENGASDEEIQALIDELEAAMKQYMQAMTEEMLRQMEQGVEFPPPPEGAQPLESADLQQMLDQMRQLSESGARDQAQQMLEQLQRMLENLQANPQAMMSSEEMQQSQEMMRQMEELVQKQQQLLDESHRQAQQRVQDGESADGEADSQSMAEQAEEQERLRRQLGEIMRDLANLTGDMPDNMGRAEQAMREAEQALEQGDPDGAIGPQTEALNQLQQGLQDMAQQYMQMFGPGRGGQGRVGSGGRDNVDPLGRRPGDASGDASDRIDLPEAGDLNRSRQILEELRKRREDSDRPQLEQDYLDRLLEQF